MLQRVGGSIGTALLAVVLQRALVGVHSLSGAAAAYGTAFWASAALTALAIIPCIVLVVTEHRARQAKRASAAVGRGHARGGGGVRPESVRTEPAPEVVDPHEQVGLSFKRAMGAMRRLRGRETHHPGELSYAQYGLLFGLAGGCALSSRELAYSADVPRRPRRRCSRASRPRPWSSASAPRRTSASSSPR